MTKNITKPNVWALMPLIIFIAIYLITSLYIGDFYKMPVLVAAIVSSLIALLMNRSRSLEDKIESFCKGAGQSNILIMVLVFILAGAFANVAKEMGAVESTVNLFLSIIPSNVIVTGIFIMACFISISIGTSVGTIAALAPMAVGISDKTGMTIALVLAAVVGGAMFGDNLSMISDTTIAATRTQGCKMRDKFKTNFLIVLPAAILTSLLYLTASGEAVALGGSYDFSIIKVIPYIAVLIAALLGVNVLVVLTGGITLAGLIGLYAGAFDIWGLLGSINSGIMSMAEIIILSLLIGGIVELIKENGGISYLLKVITKNIKSSKGAEIGIGVLVGLIDICTANNTIAIVTAGPIAKDIADEYGIEPKKSASIMDTFSCFCQGIIPYGAQLLVAASAAGISSIEIMGYLYYPYLMIIFVIGTIIIGRPNKKLA